MQTITDPSTLVCESQEDRRFARLVARTGLEPELALRYTHDPVSVLAEFGLSAAEPLYAGEFLTGGTLLIEDLDLPAERSGVGAFTLCASPTGRLSR